MQIVETMLADNSIDHDCSIDSDYSIDSRSSSRSSLLAAFAMDSSGAPQASDKTLDEVYHERTDLFLLCMKLARQLEMRTGIRGSAEDAFVVLWIELSPSRNEISIHAKTNEVPESVLRRYNALYDPIYTPEKKRKDIHDFIHQPDF